MTDAADNKPPTSGNHRKVGLAFLLVAIIGATVIYCSHRQLPPPPGWIDDDLPEAMRLAKQRGANVVVLFVAEPPSEAARWMRNGTLSKEGNVKALAERNFVAVMVRVSAGRRGEIAHEFNVTEFPTTIILSAEGEELHRQVGKIGETEFRNDFLAKVLEP